MHCINCDGELKEVFPGSGADYQYLDALDIQLHLGYGQFADQSHDGVGSPRANFCHDCSERLIEAFPGIGKMVEA